MADWHRRFKGLFETKAWKAIERAEGLWGIAERVPFIARLGIDFVVFLFGAAVVRAIAGFLGLINDDPVDYIGAMVAVAAVCWAIVVYVRARRLGTKTFLKELTGTVHTSASLALEEIPARQATITEPVPFEGMGTERSVKIHGVPAEAGAAIRPREAPPDHSQLAVEVRTYPPRVWVTPAEAKDGQRVQFKTEGGEIRLPLPRKPRALRFLKPHECIVKGSELPAHVPVTSDRHLSILAFEPRGVIVDEEDIVGVEIDVQVFYDWDPDAVTESIRTKLDEIEEHNWMERYRREWADKPNGDVARATAREYIATHPDMVREFGGRDYLELVKLVEDYRARNLPDHVTRVEMWITGAPPPQHITGTAELRL